MAVRGGNYCKEVVTKDKLLHYLNCYAFVEIIPLKDDEPIFIFKNIPYRHTLSEKYPRNLIIHKNNFILPKKKIDIGGDFSNKGHIILSPTDTDTTYLDRHRKACHPKTISMQSVFDREVKVNEKNYIKPIRDLFRKYGILQEARGKIKNKVGMAKARYDFVIQEYRKGIKLKNTKRLIQDIHDKWMDKVSEMSSNEKDLFSYTTIRRDIARYKASLRH